MTAILSSWKQLEKKLKRAPPPTPADGNTSGLGPGTPIPDGVKGFSVGALLLGPLWAAFNRIYPAALLGLVPGVGLIVKLVLAIYGREWAWRNKRWESVEAFNRIQKNWSIAGGIIVVVMIACLTMIKLPDYQRYVAELEAKETTKKEVESVVRTMEVAKERIDKLASQGILGHNQSDIGIGQNVNPLGTLEFWDGRGPHEGVAHLLFTFTEPGHRTSGGKIVFEKDLDSGKWKCFFFAIPRAATPSNCEWAEKWDA